MRSNTSLYATILSLLLTYFAANGYARAQEDGEDYDEKARVVRISLIEGEVSLKRNGINDWERARLNFPLVEGDTVSTDRDSRLEIQINARNFVRLEAKSVLRIVTLRDEGVALSVVEGTATVRLSKFDHDHEYFEVDAPRTTLAVEKDGLYRIDVSRDGRVRLTARDGGRARIYSETSGFALRNGRTAELVFDGANAGDWELLAAGQPDSWDNWVDERERYLAQRMRYDTQYYDSYVWGAEDLDAYGSWAYVNDYGWIWRPHITVINNYHNWAPYRHGHWTWCPPYGWTWVGYEPWGWAPYHYGRWVYHNNYWAWCPRSQYFRHRSWWRPALVAFNFSFGNDICWYPLSYHHRDPRSNYYRAVDRLTPLRAAELANLRRVNPANLRAVTAVPARDFGSGTARLRAADEQLARRVISEAPLRGDLPVRPANAIANGAPRSDRGERVIVARPARVTPALDLPARDTGAAARTPGTPLDNELRRSRIFNGRDPRPAALPDNNGTPSNETRPTGAVTRPARPMREPRDRPDEVNRERDENGNLGERPARPMRTLPPLERPAIPNTDDSAPRERDRRPSMTPTRPPAIENESPTDRSARPERTERPERIDRGNDRPARPERNDAPVERGGRPERIDRGNDRPARPERNDAPVERERGGRPERREREETPTARPDPPVRYEPPTQHSEPAPRSEPPPRHDPPPRHEPPPQRSEPPPRHDPPPRHEPPPQHSEPVRNDPPPRSEPPAQRSEPEPQRSEPPRSEPPPQRSEPEPQRSEPPRSDPGPERIKPPRAERKR